MFSFRNLFGKKDKPAGYGCLCDLFVLSTKDRHCDKCDLESDKCFKLHFSNQTICVTPKKEVVTFEKPKRRK